MPGRPLGLRGAPSLVAGMRAAPGLTLGLLALAAATPFPAASQDTLPAGPQSPMVFALVGEVVDALGGTPVVAAVVKAPALRRVAYTDVNGRFRLPGVPEGELEIVVEMLGYHTLEGSASVVEGNGLLLRLRPDPIALEGLAVRSRAEALLDRRRRAYPYRIATVTPQKIANAINPNPVSIFKRNANSVVVSCIDRHDRLVEAGCIWRRQRLVRISVKVDEVDLPGGMNELVMYPASRIHSMDWLKDTGTLHVYTRHYIERLNDSRMRPMPFVWPVG